MLVNMYTCKHDVYDACKYVHMQMLQVHNDDFQNIQVALTCNLQKNVIYVLINHVIIR